jgi:hypothetical protein
VVVLLIAMVPWPILYFVSGIPSAPGKASADELRGMSAGNLHGIGEAIYRYADDHGGEFPDSFKTLILTQDIPTVWFVSPCRSETPAGRLIDRNTQAIADQLVLGTHLSYVYMGNGLKQETATPNTVIAYELLSTPNVGTNVLFGDHDVKYVDAATAEKIVGQANAGVFPVTMPSN